MSKQVRWQIPFVSRLGTAYRVDIYDEGYTGSPVQLLGGTSPFTTDEDSSDDYFAPIRVQTGTLTVCTHDEDGNVIITLDDILPANNIARPVKLWRLLGGGAVGVLEWQGFLSCEAYDQDYTSIPQIIQLPVISVLEAMASVEVDQTKLSGLNNVGTTIQKLLEIFIDKAGISYFSQYYIPTAARGRNILSKYIDATVLFEQKEYNNENSTTYIVSGMSIKDCLARIATYMGWCCREVSGSLYFFAAGETSGYSRHYRQGVIDPRTGTVTIRWMVDFNETAVVSRDIVALLWAGVDHKRTVQQGAKSVEVVARMGKYELNIGIPECPVGSLSTVYRQLWKYAENGDWLYLLANTNTNAYSNMSVAYYSANYINVTIPHFTSYLTASIATLLTHIAVGARSSAKARIQTTATTAVRFYAGAFLCRYDWEKTGTAQAHETENALYCVFFPNSLDYYNSPDYPTDFDRSMVGPIFSINNVVNYRCNIGYLRLTAQADTVFMWPSDDYMGMELLHSSERTFEWFVGMELQFGNKWWNGSSWQETQTTFKARMTKSGFKNNYDPQVMPDITETDGLLIPVTTEMQGLVTLKIWPMASAASVSENGRPILEMIFSQLSIDHVVPEDSSLTDRSENHYFRLLGTNFRDEISIGTDLASTLNNQPSPSLIMEDDTTPMTELNYGTTQAPDMRRPEVDLLNRLAAYYGAARQRLDLIVEHPTAAPLPLLRLNGISPDSRTYAPLAESRDWQQDSSTIKCFETPTEPQESQS